MSSRANLMEAALVARSGQPDVRSVSTTSRARFSTMSTAGGHDREPGRTTEEAGPPWVQRGRPPGDRVEDQRQPQAVTDQERHFDHVSERHPPQAVGPPGVEVHVHLVVTRQLEVDDRVEPVGQEQDDGGTGGEEQPKATEQPTKSVPSGEAVEGRPGRPGLPSL